MSTSTQQQPQVHQGQGPVAGQSSPGTGNSLTQISAGPAALAQLMIYETMAMYANIIRLQAQQKINMVDSQIKATEAQSEETISEGNAALTAAISSGCLTAAAAIGSFAAYAYFQTKFNQESSEKMANLKKATTPMSKIEKALTAKPDPKAGEGVDSEVDALAKQFKNREYKGATKTETTKKAVQQLKDPTFEYDKWEENFRTDLDSKRREMQSITQEQNTIANKSQLISQMVNSLGQGASSIAQGAGNNAQKQHSAAANLDGTSSQIAGSASSDAGQAMAKATDAQNQEIQILEAIHRANSVN